MPRILVENNGYWLQVRGINFTPASVVLGNGRRLQKRFVSSTLLLARVPRSRLALFGRREKRCGIFRIYASLGM